MWKKVIIGILICILLGVIGYEAYNIYAEQNEYVEAQKAYNIIADHSVRTIPVEDAPEVIEYPMLSVDYDYLIGVNSDFVGWLYFPCFDISYPVVKENYYDQYLRVTFEGKPNKAGCLFVDTLSTSDFSGMHDMIFGHNMKDESMFGKLKYLSDTKYQEKLSKNPYLYIYTPEGIHQYEVFAYYVTDVGSEAYSEVYTEEEYEAFVNYIRKNSYIPWPEGLELSPDQSILTLSTCSGQSGSGKRFVIHTVKTRTFSNAL